MNIREELNESQYEAVVCLDAPSLVIAGAGSGKTRVLTYKIAHLLETGMKPWNILALTFTNKAAEEMRRRIATMVGEETSALLWMGTFHSIFSRILRQECEHIGFGRDFTIYDASDSKSLIKNILREMQLDDKVYKPAAVASRISMAKNRLILPSAYMADRSNVEADLRARMPAIGQIYMQYFQRCRASNVMDFDDLLLYTWILLTEHPDVAARWEEKFQYVLVDEYQDTNYVQHIIVWLLTQHRQRLCVVGDDAQSIYSFRGADIDNILSFQKQYRDTRLFKLEQNYRSTQTIVSAANSLIRHNRGQIPKDVYSRKEAGAPIRLLPCYSDIDEANAVVRCIREFSRQKHIPLHEMAVLYRTNAQSRTFEDVLRKSSIPYRIYSGMSFYQRKEIKDIIAYLRLIVNVHDEEALRRVINYPARGIGQTTMEKIFATARQHDITPWEVISSQEYLSCVGSAAQCKVQAFVQMIEELHQRHTQDDAYAIVLDVVERSGMRTEVNKGRTPEDIARQENLQELLDGIASFVQEHREEGQGILLTHYLQEVSLLSDVDESEKGNEDCLTLMTVHSAKGLEFRAVFVVGMEETLFPSQMCMDSPRGLEEERRLFYVAITRAGEYLTLSHSRSRFRYGKVEFCEPSRFLAEIDPRYLSEGDMRTKASSSALTADSLSVSGRPSLATSISDRLKAASSVASSTVSGIPTGAEARRFVRVSPSVTSSSPSSSPSVAGDIKVGTHLLHERFGEGVVTEISGTGMDTKAKVNFSNVGMKQLLLRFAKVKVLD